MLLHLKFLTRDPIHLLVVDIQERNTLLGAFAHSVRVCDHTKKRGPDRPLASKTCKEAVDYLAQTFRSNHRPDPRVT
jgi:hypothetical protein